LVDRTGKMLGQIVEGVKQLTDVVREISAASNEQAGGIEQVSNAIAQLDRGTQENAGLVEESAAAAETLSRQSADMVRAAAVFKLANEQRSTNGVVTEEPELWDDSPSQNRSRMAA
jgi:methyl-accepting chemotaxis protein